MWLCGGRFNLLFWSLDCKTLLIQDISDWKTDNKPLPSEYTAHITIPNGATPVPIVLKTGIINTFTMEDFGYGKSQLFDGIYCVKIQDCENEILIHRALACRLNCCYKQMVAGNKEVSNESKELIKSWIEDIPLLVEVGRLNEAKSLFEMTRRELKNLNYNCK